LDVLEAAGIKTQKLKYANTLASLPKQVLWDILDTLDVCDDSDEPLNFLKNTLLGQFGKSKWQSYFELLRLPMQGLKPRLSSFTTDIVGCWVGALWRACNLTAFTPCLTGPVCFPS
jgi:hypothetical protein